MVTKTAEELRQLTRQILEAAGAVPDQAEIVAEHLVLANLRGVDSHGVWHIQGYVQAIQDGHIRVAAEPKIARETPASALVRGDWAFGHVVARFGMRTAIDKAREQGLAVVSLVQTHHIGRLGHYAEMAAAEGMISMVWAGGQGAEKPAAVPYGGRKALFHTNPIAMGLPAGSQAPSSSISPPPPPPVSKWSTPSTGISSFPPIALWTKTEIPPPTPESTWTAAPTCPSAATRAMR